MTDTISLRRSPRTLLARDGHPGPGPGKLGLVMARAGVGKCPPGIEQVRIQHGDQTGGQRDHQESGLGRGKEQEKQDVRGDEVHTRIRDPDQ